MKGQFTKGCKPWNKGKKKPYSPETIEKMRLAKLGKRGSETNNFKGGKTISSQGYILIRVDGKYVEEHRYKMEQKLGRKLLPTEIVHHKNENGLTKQDNDDDNLELKSNQSVHAGGHIRKRGSDGKFKAGEEKWIM